MREYREKVLEMFYHGYDNYMTHAFPLDELKPISCSGHDTLGSYHLTLIDSLDMLAVIGNITEFEKQVRWATGNVHFTKHKNISVFETNIRILGGLLSSHLLAQKHLEGYPWGGRSLLDLAKEIGDILYKAFDTETGIPYGTVNCANGGFVPTNEVQETSVACSTTYSLEFGLLSRLLNDFKYENAARKAVEEIWNRRSKLNLLGNHINITTGDWKAIEATIGGNVDSFYEYLIKSALLFGDTQYLEIFLPAYQGVIDHMFDQPWYVQVDMNSGSILQTKFESLTAFWPGLQVMIGDLHFAIPTMHHFHSVWQRYGFVPESYNYKTGAVQSPQYPLRPEMAESLYYLYSATRDPIWLSYAKEMIHSLNLYTRVECGFAAVEKVQSKDLRDHMDSFFLSETCKYLYLLFSPSHWIHSDPSSSYIFNTEGHPFPMRYEWLKGGDNHALYGKCADAQIIDKLTHADFQPRLSHLSFFDTSDYLSSLPAFPPLNPSPNPSPSPTSSSSPSPSSSPSDKPDEEEGGEVVGVSYLLNNQKVMAAGSLAMFGPRKLAGEITSSAVIAAPLIACTPLTNPSDVSGKIAIVMRGTCEFTVKVRHCQSAGAIAVIVVDNEKSKIFVSVSMFGEDPSISIPSLFLSHNEGSLLINTIAANPQAIITLEANSEEMFYQTATIDLEQIMEKGIENIEETLRELFGDLLDQEQIDSIKKVIYSTVGVDYSPVVGKAVLSTCIDGDC